MSGLVEYGSSDEDDAPQKVSRPPGVLKVNEEPTILHASVNGEVAETNANGHSIQSDQQIELNAPMVGPALGPSDPHEADMPSPSADADADLPTPQSPYSANRTRIRQLTLPSLPNLDMPDSPPGSPPAGTNTKFAHFLKLKKEGVHFNEKLAKSSAIKNPSMMQKLMDFADIDEAGQYATTLSKELWDPNGFPEWAYKEELAKSQQKILKKKEEDKTRGQRESLDFVPATASEGSSRSGTPGANAGSRVGTKSAAERVMAGLDRGKLTSPAVQAGMKRKTRFES